MERVKRQSHRRPTADNRLPAISRGCRPSEVGSRKLLPRRPTADDRLPTILFHYRTPEGFDDLVLVSDGEAVTGIYFAGSQVRRFQVPSSACPAGAPSQKTLRSLRSPRENQTTRTPRENHSLRSLRSLREIQTPRTPRTPREVFQPVSAWLDRYFSCRDPGPPPAWRTPGLTPFQLRVQQALLEIPRGETRTYGDIAAEIARERGIPRVSAQAVGQAVGHNPLCILVPCHRVVGAGGRLVGYGGGLANKKALLELEQSR